ncbi:enolase C-terminal domain-like protein [Lentzea sp. CA-135723]|uniref:enolase C-terminal domain-like protein n=1 Tax=Lentzea sp. CA-135723 TaxID=3239950 RepID=UPI003D8AFB10
MISDTRLTIDVSVEPLPLRRSFEISHMTIESVDIVRLVVSGDGESGLGEIAADLGYGQDSRQIAQEAAALAAQVDARGPRTTAELCAALLAAGDLASGPARMLVEMAFLDRAAKQAGVPVWRLVDLPEPGEVRLLHTVPIGEEIPAAVRPVKIKLGGRDDDAVLAGLVGVPGPVILDVNCGWDAADWQRLRAVVTEIAPAVLEDPVRDRSLLAEIRAALPGTAVILDEGVNTAADVAAAIAIADGANTKLMRLGGLLPGRAVLTDLAERGATRMLGCFLEPPRAIAYAAQVAGLCDWTDLDGHFWLVDTEPVMSYRLDSSAPGVPVIAA